MVVSMAFLISSLAKLEDSTSGMPGSSVRRIFERGWGGGGRKFKKFENNKDQIEKFPAQNQVRFPAQI